MPKWILFAAVFAATLLFADAGIASAPMGIMEAIELTLGNNSGLKSLRQEAAKASALKVQTDALWTDRKSVV